MASPSSGSSSVTITWQKPGMTTAKSVFTTYTPFAQTSLSERDQLAVILNILLDELFKNPVSNEAKSDQDSHLC
jgi:hypothetical protein